jgi:predicted nucleic acid-binding protein
MIFADIPQGTAVFIDANPFVYHFGPHAVFAPACTDLLERINRQEIKGLTCARVLSDVAHRLMTLEAQVAFGWPASGIAGRLKKHPSEIQKLTRFRQALLDIPGFGIQLLDTLPTLVEHATTLGQNHGLLSGDALIVAVLQHHGLRHLASHDADFDRLPGLTRYGPI